MSLFNNADLYPTPLHVIDLMLQDQDLQDKTVLEPSAGTCNIVNYLINAGANVLACEIDKDLVKLIPNKATFLKNDFLQVQSHEISHVDLIVLNPPFSADEFHVNHAFNIAPDGCKIIALCNANTVKNDYTRSRRELKSNIDLYGTFYSIDNAFSDSERPTGVEIGLITLTKPGGNEQSEYEGFFMEEDPEEAQFNGLMPYNFIRDVVNRYVAVMKIYDSQLESAIKINQLTAGFYTSSLAFSCSVEDKPKTKAEFKKDLQKSAWTFILKKMKMEKYTTQGLKDELNKFVEKQNQIPFTMRNIYRMLEQILGTHSGRMDKALLEVFERLTSHYHENRFNLEGWKTNSHYLVNQKFIMPSLCGRGYHGNIEINDYGYAGSNTGIVNDFQKALCYLTGQDYGKQESISNRVRTSFALLQDGKPVQDATYKNVFMAKHFKSQAEADAFLINNPDQGYSILPNAEWGQWFDWSFFEVRCYKKGTAHFKFKDESVWALFNQNIARIMGYPLPESLTKKQAA